jgi:hypothetical protein
LILFVLHGCFPQLSSIDSNSLSRLHGFNESEANRSQNQETFYA